MWSLLAWLTLVREAAGQAQPQPTYVLPSDPLSNPYTAPFMAPYSNVNPFNPLASAVPGTYGMNQATSTFGVSAIGASALIGAPATAAWTHGLPGMSVPMPGAFGTTYPVGLSYTPGGGAPGFSVSVAGARPDKTDWPSSVWEDMKTSFLQRLRHPRSPEAQASEGMDSRDPQLDKQRATISSDQETSSTSPHTFDPAFVAVFGSPLGPDTFDVARYPEQGPVRPTMLSTRAPARPLAPSFYYPGPFPQEFRAIFSGSGQPIGDEHGPWRFFESHALSHGGLDTQVGAASHLETDAGKGSMESGVFPRQVPSYDAHRAQMRATHIKERANPEPAEHHPDESDTSILSDSPLNIIDVIASRLGHVDESDDGPQPISGVPLPNLLPGHLTPLPLLAERSTSQAGQDRLQHDAENAAMDLVEGLLESLNEQRPLHQVHEHLEIVLALTPPHATGQQAMEGQQVFQDMVNARDQEIEQEVEEAEDHTTKEGKQTVAMAQHALQSPAWRATQGQARDEVREGESARTNTIAQARKEVEAAATGLRGVETRAQGHPGLLSTRRLRGGVWPVQIAHH